MISKKKTTFGREPDLKLDDLDFDFGSLDKDMSKKDAKRRTPIMKVTTNVAKGAGAHLTSESFIRSTLGRALPEGYSTAIETGYEIRDTLSQLYNSAGNELRKNAPAAARVVERLMPKADKFAPKFLQDKLKRFVNNNKSSGGASYSADDNQLREVLAEFESIGVQERMREKAEDKIGRGLQQQIDTRRFSASIKALASIDARLATLTAYNDQTFTRYQRRSLEIQYRQYFTARDTLKLHTTEMAQTRQLLSAIVHNTALPDGVKSKMREKYGEGLRERLSASSQQAIVGYTSNFFRNMRDRATSGIKNFGTGLAGGLDGANMSAEMMDMMRASGMDVSGESQKAAGGMVAQLLANLASVAVSGSFKRTGHVAQAGARAGRVASSIPDRLNSWASSPTKDFGWKGTLSQLLKDQVQRHQQNKWLGSTFIQQAGDPGTFTKKTQRSIEEIMPGYLARILHELRVTRTGNEDIASPVWSDDKSRFVTSTLADRTKMVKEKLYNNRQATYGRERVKSFVDEGTAEATLSPGARHELEKAVTRAVISGQTLKVTDFMRNSHRLGIDPKYAKEIANAVRGRFRTQGSTDQVTLGEFSRKYQALRSTVPDVKNMVGARMELGQHEELEQLGLLNETDEGFTMNYDNSLHHMVGAKEKGARVSHGRRQAPEYVGSEYGGLGSSVLKDTRVNLFRVGMTVPTIEGFKILQGVYLNAKTFQPIRLMREILDGVVDAHTKRIIVTAEQAAKLVTPSGETLPEFLARAQPKNGKFSVIGKGADWVSDKIRGASEKADAFFTTGKGSQYVGRPGRSARRRAFSQARSATDQFAAKTAATASSMMGASKETLAEAAASPYAQRAKDRMRNLWTRVVNTSRYSISLYKSGSLTPVIEAEALRAGEYISATTGKVITDLRELAEGVKHKDGTWVASAEEVADELRTSEGTPFEKLMDGIQEAVENHHGPAARSGTASAAVSKITSPAAASTFSPTTTTVNESESTQDPLYELVKEFKEGNLQHLAEILEVVATRDFGGGGGVPGDPNAKPRGGVFGRGARGAWGVTKKLGKMYGSYVKGVFGLQRKAIGFVGGLFGKAFIAPKDHLGKEPSDVFVGKERNPRLNKGAMMAGDYVNADGTPIRVPKDIKGVVKNTSGETLIDEEALRQGLHDGKGRSLVSNLTRMAWNGALGLTKMYGQAFMLPIKIAQGAFSVAKLIANAAKIPQDVYTPDDLKNPKLRAFAMRAGNYIDRDSGKRIHSVQDINGPVLDTSKTPPILALSAEDISKGIVDANGKPFKVKGSLLGRLAHGLLGGAGMAVGGFGRLIGHMTRAGASLAALPFRMLSGLFGKKGLGKMSLFGQSSDEKTHELLTEVLKLLDARMPESEHYRAGSWQDILKRRNAAKKDAAGKTGKDTNQQSMWSKIWDKLKGGGEDHDDEHDDHGGGGGDTYINENGERVQRTNNAKDAKGRKRGGWRRKMDAAAKRRNRAAGGKGGERTGMGSKKAGWWERLKGGAKGAAKSAKPGRFGALGKVAGGLKGFGLGMLANYALGKVGDVAGHDSTVGKVADGAGTALGVVGTAQTLGSILTALGVEGGLIGAATGIGGAIATGVGTLAATIGAILASPVVAVGAAVAAVGTGIYYGAKYYGLKKNAPLRKYRMAQYGLDMGKGVWAVDKIQKLEDMLLPHVKVVQGKATVDEKGLKYDDILKIFGLSYSWYNPVGWFHGKDDAGDTERKKSFLKWFATRFRPIFFAWVAARDHTAPSVDFDDLDGSLKPAQKKEILTAVHGVNVNIYGAMDSPFSDPLNADPKTIEQYYQDAMKAAGDDKTTAGSASKLAVAGGAAGPAVTALTAKAGGASASAGAGVSVSLGGLPSAVLAKAQAGKAQVGGGGSGGAPLKAKVAPGLAFFSSDKLSALAALRYRTYGLTDLDTDRVKAMFLLEAAVFDDVRYGGDGAASFQGDVDYYFSKFAGYFGVSVDDNTAKVRWYSWFSKRFIPTVLQFGTAVKRAKNSVNPLDADDYLSPAHLLDVANMTMAATFTQDGRSASVWTLTDSPFDAVPLNSDSNTVKDNLESLKQAVQRRTMDEEKAKTQAKKDAIDQAAAKQNQASGKTADGRPVAANDAQYLTRQKLESKLPTGLEAGSNAANKWIANGGKPGDPVGVQIKQPGNGTAGDINKLPMPTGSGKEAMAPLLAAVGKMTGIDPNLLNIFAGIESSWNPSAAAPGSSAKGLFQFVGGTWKEKLAAYASKYGIDPSTSPLDPRASALMGAEFIRENQTKLTKALGRTPTDTELYLAHFMGPGGASTMLKAGDNDLAASIAGNAAVKANPTIFYRNGQALTKAALMKFMDSKVAKFRGGSTAQVAKAYEAPTTGGVTTTTANGAKGGVGMSTPEQAATTAMQASGDLPGGDGAKKLANVGPTGASPKVAPQAPATGAAANDDGSADPIAAQQQQRLQRAQASDRAAQSAQATQQDSMGSVTGYLKQQTEHLGDISDKLGIMLGHTQALPALADAAGKATGTTGPDAGPSAIAQSKNAPPRTSEAVDPPVVSMKRASYT